MPDTNNPGPFDHKNFPPIDDPANEETGKAELYPENLQDEVNETYNHNKVLPRVDGVDYTPDKKGYDESLPEDKSTFEK